MQNCPRSCPSRIHSEEAVREVDTSEDCLPESVVGNIMTWKSATHRPLVMRPYDTASYDEHNQRFQEYQKSAYEFQYQLHNGMKYSS